MHRAAIETLHTARLTLRPMVEADRADVIRLVGDYDVSKMLTQVAHPYTDAHFDEFLSLRGSPSLGIIWMICDTDGLCGAVSIGTELGYWLGKPSWGKGYMTEAAQAAVDAVFSHTNLPLIKSSHFEINGASQRVLEKLGFEDVGSHTHYSLARDCEIDGRSMLLSRARWENRRG